MKRIGISFLFIVSTAFFAYSQEAQNTKNSADQTLRSNGTVNPSSLGLEMSIPLGGYQGRGITLPLGLNYSSKLWRLEAEAVWVTPSGGDGGELPENGHTWTYAAAKYAEDSASGFTSSISQPYIEYTGTYTSFNNIGTPNVYDYWQPACNQALGPCPSGDYFIKRITARLPNATYELRLGDAWVQNYSYQSADGIYLSVDGSGVKYVQNTSISLYRLYMPDGSYYDFKETVEEKSSTDYHNVRRARKLFDPHGNYITFNDPNPNDPNDNGSITDTLGRTFPVVVPREAPEIPQNDEYVTQSYTLPGMSNSYVFKWERLEDAFGQPGYVTRYKGHTKKMYPSPVYGNSLFEGDQMSECSPDRLLITVDWEDGQAMKFNPAVLTDITLPNGAKYEFLYNEYGEVERINYPAGGYEEYTHQQVASLAQLSTPYQVVNRGVVQRKVYESSGATPSTWSYSATSSKNRYRTTVTAPDNTKTERFMHRGVPPPECYQHEPGGFPANTYGLWWGYDNVLSGRPFEERVFNSSNQIVQKTITKWDRSEGSILMTQSPQRAVQLNPRTTWTQTITYDGDAGVAAATKLEYHDGFNSPGSPLNVRYKKEYSYQVVSDGNETVFNETLLDAEPTLTDPTTGQTPLRVTETTYKTDFVYLNRNLLRLPVEVKVTDGSGNVKAKTEVTYDTTQTLLTDVSSTRWTNPNTTYRGLATLTKTWHDISANQFAETKAQYDQLGNLRNSWDGRNNLTQTAYSSTYDHAFPTSVTTSIADPTGVNGSNTAFTTTTVYNYDTGLPTSTTDINTQTTTMEYVDPLLRPTKVTAPNGHQTITEYGAGTDANSRWLKVKSQIDASSWKEALTWYDGLGRTVKTQTVDGTTGDVFVETQYDSMGRVEKISNPYRANDTIYWTENTFDTAGRPWKVATSGDNAVVETTYSIATSGSCIGTSVTVEDQADKQRRSLTNALGQLCRVDEPTTTGTSLGAISSPNQPTYYEYDLFNNLTKVKQGGTLASPEQTRDFTYDAMSRLKSAVNPESGTINYTYDNNSNVYTKTDARSISTTYTYDALNRVTLRNYSDTTPDVSYYYDNLSNAKGKLIKVTSSVSTTEYTAFDTMGRVTAHKQTTDGTAYNTGYTYDLAGNLLEETYPSTRVVKNVLDNNGDLAMVESKKTSSAGYWAYANSFTCNAAGAVSSMQLGNGHWESTNFNSRLQPFQIALGTLPGQTNLLSLQYSYGDWVSGSIDATKNNGNIVKQVITVPNSPGQDTNAFTATQKYYYDALNRIDDSTEEINAAQTGRQDFSYDRYGNRNFVEANTTTIPRNCGGAICALDHKIYNPAINTSNNRVSTSDGYSFDNAGNTASDALGRTFIYDAENKQVEVKTGTTVHGQYFYDGDGKRVKKIVPATGEVTIFVYDASGKSIAEYSTLVASLEEAKVAYLTNDHLGSPRVNTDSNGAVVARHDYHPFGEEITTSQRIAQPEYGGDSVRKQFTGYERDIESQLDFAQARYYINTLGRFTSADPILESARRVDPQSWNRYNYVLNNPLRYVDPRGEDYEDLTEKQRKLIDDWAARQNVANKTDISAQKMYDALDTSRRATFEATTNALENTTITGKDGTTKNGLDLVKSITFINGDKSASGENTQRFRLFVELNEGAKDFLMTAKNFKTVPGHEGYPDSRQMRGGEPSIQVSMTKDGRGGDIDVDYESKKVLTNIFTGFKHLKASNSDVRHSDHFDKHNKQFGKGPIGPLKRRYEPIPPK